MRTKTRGVRRNTGAQILEDDRAVTAHVDVGSASASLHPHTDLNTAAWSHNPTETNEFFNCNINQCVNGSSQQEILLDGRSIGDAGDVGSAFVGIHPRSDMTPHVSSAFTGVCASSSSDYGQRNSVSMDVDVPFSYIQTLPHLGTTRTLSTGITINESSSAAGVRSLCPQGFSA